MLIIQEKVTFDTSFFILFKRLVYEYEYAGKHPLLQIDPFPVT